MSSDGAVGFENGCDCYIVDGGLAVTREVAPWKPCLLALSVYPLPDISRRCNSCGSVCVRPRRCVGCSQVRYCSGACQLDDWRKHRYQCPAGIIRGVLRGLLPIYFPRELVKYVLSFIVQRCARSLW